ncbi:frg1-like family protein [Niveomyces insectorum RCEF 264]|uniref:Frg1-like family protein n=1 Tax=Niveomyces insectorum RCEF 264 TaxID=1081102 RepID=A0A167WFQ5_9HYPO|nr:frg1-like family protein [Niveomyces insectorum RCEF 264]
MVKPLTFKGDKKVKKRKRKDKDTSEEAQRKRALLAAAGGDEEVADDDTWVSAESLGDVVGPVMIVLPSKTPAALSSDANGTVFAMPVENIVDGNPSSAEPHDVRQVWVASRVAGSEQFLFKGHHGKYLGCDKYGFFSANAMAVSPLESFTLVETESIPETFQIKTQRGTFLSVQEPALPSKVAAGGNSTTAPDVRGDATESQSNTTVRIRMQARFKPRVKASKEEKAREKISRRELEDAVGRRLEDDEVKLLKRARREGDYHEKLLDVKMKYKHDKYG